MPLQLPFRTSLNSFLQISTLILLLDRVLLGMFGLASCRLVLKENIDANFWSCLRSITSSSWRIRKGQRSFIDRYREDLRYTRIMRSLSLVGKRYVKKKFWSVHENYGWCCCPMMKTIKNWKWLQKFKPSSLFCSSCTSAHQGDHWSHANTHSRSRSILLKILKSVF